MDNTYEKTVQMTIKVSPGTYKSLQKLAAKGHENMSEVVRRFIKKGLDVEGYRDDLEFITGIIRQVVSAEIGKQANRLAAMFFKVGVISSSNYFLSARALSDMISPSLQEDFKDIHTKARRLGIDYMKMNGVGVVEFLEDDEEVERAVDKLKTDYTAGY